MRTVATGRQWVVNPICGLITSRLTGFSEGRKTVYGFITIKIVWEKLLHKPHFKIAFIIKKLCVSLFPNNVHTTYLKFPLRGVKLNKTPI